ncbi:hypothetical protein CPB83DRAFT_895895 [Crepidotus variabilis]|uniref:Uncharacterized protein n=1 Tax=Crepidotus variabilis TaxID=179855 RepID=A0A9P6EDC8_9AGAR|nr:hypothetical protein CPB83DRAFT_895895 [Crepidotus variabilis]
MVHSSKFLVISSVAGTAFAAPYLKSRSLEFELETREPRFNPAKIMRYGHILHKIAHGFRSTAETAATIRSMIHKRAQEEAMEFERELGEEYDILD